MIQDDFTVYSAVKEIDILKSNNNKLEERTIALREQFEKVSEKCSSLNDLCEQKDLEFSKLSKVHVLILEENTKLKNEIQEIKAELSNRKKEYQSLSASLEEKDLKLKQALKDNNKLKDDNTQIKGELRDGEKQIESLNSSMQEKEIKLKQEIRDKKNLNIQNINITTENRQILNEFHKIKSDHMVLNACINQKILQSNKKKLLRLFDHFQLFFQIK